MDVVTALAQRGGASRRAPLLADGVSWRALDSAVASGAVVRVATGLYAVPGCAPEQVARAAVGGVLSCLDAARGHGLAVLRPDPLVHVAAGRGSSRRWPGTVVHRTGSGGSGRAVALGLLATLVSVAGCSPMGTAVALVDEVLRTGRLTPAELQAASGPRDVRWRTVLAAADARSMSALESLARVELVSALRALGLRVEVQACLRGVGRVDLLVDGWLVVELDGFAFHADRDSYRRDRRRDQVLSSHGYGRLRFCYEDVVSSPAWVDRVVDTWRAGRPPWFRDLRGTSGTV